LNAVERVAIIVKFLLNVGSNKLCVTKCIILRYVTDCQAIIKFMFMININLIIAWQSLT